jgi:membrane associated rhomboid family serine protease
MDWSLVLLSQDIETVIQAAEGGWELVVSPEDYDSAQEAIRLYQQENRRPVWRQEMQPGLLFDWTSLAWTICIAAFYWLTNHSGTDLGSAGFMDPAGVRHGQWWRLFTAMWLHADLSHLAMNAVFGFFLLGLTMGRYGTGIGILAAYLAGAGGNIIVSLVAVGPHHSLGASGMVMGALGLLTAQSFTLWRHAPQAAKSAIAALCGGVMLFVLLGLTPGTDILAHLGGFVSGLVLGLILNRGPAISGKALANLLSGFLFAGLVILPWWLALRHA